MLPAALFLLLAPLARGAPPGEPGMEALASRLEGVADDLAGPGLIRVFLRTEPAPAGAPEKPAALWDRMLQRRGRTPPVLPGYRLPESLPQEAAAALRSLQAREPALRWSLTAVAARSLAEEDLQAALSAFREILDLDEARGDRVRVIRADLRPRPAAGEVPDPSGAWLPWTLAAALLLCGAGAFLLRGRPAAASPALGAPEPLASPPMPRELPREERPPRQEAERAPPASRPPLAPFLPALDPRRADAMAEALAAEGGAGLSEALRALDCDLAAEVFRRLPLEKRREAARALLAPGAPPPPAAASALRDRLRRSLGARRAQDALEDILLRAAEEDRSLVLRELLAADPRRALALERRLPTPERLAASDPAALRSALSLFSSRELACLLRAVSAQAREAFAEALPALVREEAGRLAGALPPAPPEEARRLLGRLYGRWRRLADPAPA